MEQMYCFYTVNHPKRLTCASEYKQIGSDMFRKYPAIRRLVVICHCDIHTIYRYHANARHIQIDLIRLYPTSYDIITSMGHDQIDLHTTSFLVQLFLAVHYTYISFVFPNRQGKHPWSLLTRVLSGRIRTRRYNEKRKSSSESGDSKEDPPISPHTNHKGQISRRSAGPQVNATCSEDDYILHKKECQKECSKAKPNVLYIKKILQVFLCFYFDYVCFIL